MASYILRNINRLQFLQEVRNPIAETNEDDDADIHFKIANEGLDGDKEENNEVFKPKVKSNSSKICESSKSDCEDTEVVEPTVKRKPRKGLDTVSMEN